MAHEWLRQYSQADFASRPSLHNHGGFDEPSVGGNADIQKAEEHAESRDWDRSWGGSQVSYPESVDPSEKGSVNGNGLQIAVEDSPSAPIDVPLRSRDGHAIPQASSSASGLTEFDSPSPESYIENRKTSIGFDPKVRLEGNHEAHLKDPLPKLSLRTRTRGKSLLDVMAKDKQRSRPRSETDSQEYDSMTGRRLDEKANSYQDLRYTGNSAEWPLSQSAIDELGSRDQLGALEQSTSLNSRTSLSSYDGARLPPPAEGFGSPLSTSSPARDWFGEQSQELPRRLSSRSKSYAIDRPSWSLRPSRRSTATSSASPASAFLSKYLPSSPLPNPDDEGQEVGDYVLGREVGAGGFSVIREAFTLSESTRIARAVKIVRRNVAGKEESENEALQAEFEHEVELWRTLSHPHVLPLIAVYNTDFATFAFTHLNTGGTLFDAVRKNRSGLEPRLARRYIAQLASAIRYLHEDMHIAHRDIKLENCLLDMTAAGAAQEGGKLLLCDFGMADYLTSENGVAAPSQHPEQKPAKAATFSPTPAQSQGAGNDPRTPAIMPANMPSSSDSPANVAGTLPYAAPEMLETSTRLLNTYVDMWAFGVLCFAVVMGKLPFSHAFAPRMRMMIIGGEWDKEGLRAKEWHSSYEANGSINGNGSYFPSETKVNGNGAISCWMGVSELIEGCLTLDVQARWDIQDILCSPWLKEEVEKFDPDV